MLIYLLFSSNLPFLDKLLMFVAFIIAAMVALTVHEFAHAFVAHKCGDDTAKAAGRLTLNPIKHLDVTGFICFALFGFGWAKPVPINSYNFKNIKRDSFWVSVSGVLSNIILAFILIPFWFLIIQYWGGGGYAFEFFEQLFEWLVFLNIIYFVFNLLPIYPLDGFNAIAAYLKYQNKFVIFMLRYSFLILIGFLIVVQIIYSMTGVSIILELANYVSWPLQQFWLLFF